MAFYFRKSLNFGPVRLNFSKSGIGVSAGIKGARISTGPRGTYVHAGRNGFYYTQRIGGTSSTNTVPSPATSPQAIPGHSQSQHNSGQAFAVQTASAGTL